MVNIEDDVSYKVLRSLSKYLELKGVRFGTKKRKYEKVMKVFNNQKNFMKHIRDDFCLSKTPQGFNKKDFLDQFIFYKTFKNKDFKYDEIRLLWD